MKGQKVSPPYQFSKNLCSDETCLTVNPLFSLERVNYSLATLFNWTDFDLSVFSEYLWVPHLHLKEIFTRSPIGVPFHFILCCGEPII